MAPSTTASLSLAQYAALTRSNPVTGRLPSSARGNTVASLVSLELGERRGGRAYATDKGMTLARALHAAARQHAATATADLLTAAVDRARLLNSLT